MSDKSVIAWAGSRNHGPPAPWSVCSTRKSCVEKISEGAIGAGDYDRLDRSGRWKLARRNGWRVVKVTITRAPTGTGASRG